jgi:hypothetical protein
MDQKVEPPVREDDERDGDRGLPRAAEARHGKDDGARRERPRHSGCEAVGIRHVLEHERVRR